MNSYFDMAQSGALMKIYDGTKHTEVSEEFILPDYLPDVKRIIRVDARPKLDSKFVAAGKVDYEGDVVCHVLFCDEGNHLKNVTFTASFADGIKIDGIEDECVANLIPIPESVTCKMLNPRRASIRLRIDTSVTVWCHREFEPKYIGNVSEKALQKSEREVEVMELVCAGETGLNANAELEADGALPQIGEIISCNVDMSFYECKGSEGKVLCRGDMPITVFYSSQEGDGEAYTVLFRKIPLAQVVLAEGVDDGYSCMARGAVDNVRFDVLENGFGERRIVNIDVDYRVYLNCVGKTRAKVVNDVYALGKDIKEETEKETFCRFSRLYSTSFAANMVVPKGEITLNESGKVFALSAYPKLEAVTLTDDGARLTVTGKALASAVIKGEDGLEAHEYELPFKTELEAQGVGKSFIYNYDIVCVSARGRFDSENFYTELDMQLNLMLLETEEIEVLKKAEFSDKTSEDEEPQMRFYYPSEGETLWEIGKQFGISIESLTEKNDITGEVLPSVLYIPSAKA